MAITNNTSWQETWRHTARHEAEIGLVVHRILADRPNGRPRTRCNCFMRQQHPVSQPEVILWLLASLWLIQGVKCKHSHQLAASEGSKGLICCALHAIPAQIRPMGLSTQMRIYFKLLQVLHWKNDTVKPRQTLPKTACKSLRKNKSVFMCHDPVSINIHMVGRYPQNMPQERTAVYSRGGSGPAATLRAGLKSEPERAKHMLAMLWLELASLVFSGYGFDPFGLKAQSS